MGDMADLQEEYLNAIKGWNKPFNQQNFIRWLCDSDVEEFEEERHISNFVFNNLQSELNLIKDLTIKTFATACIDTLPKYWRKPSAYHEGHHPKDELVEWGNLKHVKRVIKIAIMLSEIENLSTHENDLLIAATLIHDIGKYGIDGNADKILTNHPMLVSQMVNKYNFDDATSNDVLTIVESHMGRWGIPRPSTLLQWICHYADYIASRDSIIIPITITSWGER